MYDEVMGDMMYVKEEEKANSVAKIFGIYCTASYLVIFSNFCFRA